MKLTNILIKQFKSLLFISPLTASHLLLKMSTNCHHTSLITDRAVVVVS